MPHDVWLVILISFGVFFFTSIFWIAYGGFKADQMRQTHQEELELARADNRVLSDMVTKTEIQARVLGSTPVSRLIGNSEDTP